MYEGEKTIWGVDVGNGGTGFNNNDIVVISSALVVNVATGTFANSDTLVDPVSGAQAFIEEVDTASISGKTVLKVRPLDAHLTNSSINSLSWSFDLYSTVTNQGNTVSATIENKLGQGATGRIVTNAVGSISEIIVTNRGKGYTVTPQVSVKTANNSATVGSLALVARNYIAKVAVASAANSVGSGYGFQVTDGIIYDVGTFCRVGKQTIIVDKYSPTPNNVVVGFETQEQIVDYTEDSSLLDNAIGEPSENGPGADRLKLTPTLVVISKEEAASRTDFLPLVEWNDGQPYIQNQSSTYSRLGDTMAQQIYDQSGNFVLDAFQVTTTFVANTEQDSHRYSVVVDPGQAYINGRKVQTLSNYRVDLDKGTDTLTANNRISLAYGNYIRVNNVMGIFDVSAGAEVIFYSIARKALESSTVYNDTISPLGREIGTAKIRSFELENGTPGSADAIYRMYLFDIRLNPGENFRDIKSIYYNDATYDAIADVITEYNATVDANIAELKETNYNSLLFSAGVDSLKNSNNTTYIYRTSAVCNTQISTGTLVVTSTDPEYLPYGTNRDLSFVEMQEFVVTPAQTALVLDSAFGNVDVSSSSNTVTGTGNFLSEFKVGDYIFIQSGGLDATRRVTAIVSASSLRVDTPPGFANTEATYRRIFPENIPIPFGTRVCLTANIDLSGQEVTFQFAHSNGEAMAFTAGSAQVETKVTYNVERRNVSSANKTANRSKYVKICLANNDYGIDGPWCLGVPDVFRLRAVYLANTINVNTSSREITSDFYIDHNQNQNYLNHSWLFRRGLTNSALTDEDTLLVCFDYFTRDDAGYFDTRSYLRTADANTIREIDSSTFEDLSANQAACTWEIPEVYTYDNKEYDLINTFDFRPAVDATASPGNNPAGAPVNPPETVTFTGLSKFPAPRSVMTTQVEQYLGRIDDVYIGESGHIYVLKGIPDVNPRRRLQSNHPKDSLRLQMLNVPPYPGLTAVIGANRLHHIDTGVGNERAVLTRGVRHAIEPILSTTNLQISQPMVYTMEDIGNLERRIRDLEYYVSLSVLETNITNKIIPSSIDPALNRFKYGFFADDFSTTIYSDLGNPAYAASIESEGDLTWGTSANPLTTDLASADKSTDLYQPSKIIQKETFLVTPPKYVWSMKHFTENMYFVDTPILAQNNATEQVDPCVIDSDSTTVGTAYYTSINRRQSQYYSEGLPGLTTLYFHTFGYGAKIDVYNANNVLVASTVATRNDVRELTAADRQFLSTNEFAKSFYTGISTSGFNNSPTRLSVDPNYIYGPGKLTFNSARGRHTVMVDSFSGFDSSTAKFLVAYPSIQSAFDSVINSPACDPNPPLFIGSLSAGTLSLIQWSCSNLFRANSTNYKAFVIEGTGLKPNTIHKLELDGEEWTHAVNLTQDLFSKAQKFYGTHKSHGGKGSMTTGENLASSKAYQYSQANFFLAAARDRLYNSDGSRTDYTYLKTDSSGKLRAIVFFPMSIAGWFAQDFNAEAYVETAPGEFVDGKYVAGKGTNATNTATNNKQIGLKPTVGSSGYATIRLVNADGTSEAIRVFAARMPGKNIPSDPKGSI